ncbi:MAG TPA: hypothetical protein VM049_01150 [Gaiellaceae bacterium]|nr:hypothetical protein [Gaiellaceae bacterium]
MQAARDAAERLGALEHRRLLDTGGDSKWYALDDLLEQRLKAYVEAHPDDFFAESAAARANEARVRAKLADDAIWLVETQADIDREIEAQEWLVDQFGARGRYSQESEWLLLRPEAMREALGAVASAGYAPRELIFLDEDQVIIETVDVEREPEIELQAGVERHEPAWVAVIAR